LLAMPPSQASGWILSAATEVFESVDALKKRLREAFASETDG
jgi:hypothetical protein